jgi:hypothetical protein
VPSPFQLALVRLGLVLIYVDDAMGTCRRQDLVQCKVRAAKGAGMVALLGDDAVADERDVNGRAIDDIGYCGDLDARFDASLSGIGMVAYEVTPMDPICQWGGAAVSIGFMGVQCVGAVTGSCAGTARLH